MKKQNFSRARMCLLVTCICCSFIKTYAQNVTIAVNATQNKRPISQHIYGRNESLDKPDQFYKDAGLRFARIGGGNNMSAYNWRAKLAVHPDWFNNVYGADWDVYAKKINTNFSNVQSMFAFQLLGRVASSGQHNFPDWEYMQSHPGWFGNHQNLAGDGTPNPDDDAPALVEGNKDLFSKPWPADSSVAILNHWFGANGLGLNKNKFLYWSMDNEVDIWSGTHDWAMPTQLSAAAFMDRYIELAKKAKALYPGIKLCGPVNTSEWHWYKWASESIYIDGRYYPWLEYFIKRLADEYKATGIKLVDVVDIHNYPWYNSDDAAALQGHRIYFDETYDYPGSNGIRTSTGGWDTSLTKQYIFKRVNDWLTEHFGANHGITTGVSEWGTMSSSNPSLESVIYASHLGTFANHGVELFTPWNWSIGMWETLHLFSRNAKKYSISSTSSLENTVSAYSSVNENSDSLTVILVNRDMGASRTVTINLSNFTVANGNYKTLQLSSLPATETFVSHTENALKANTVSVNSNSLTITVPSLSTTAILLTKAASPVTYLALANRATGMMMDGLYRANDGSEAGQWHSSGSTAQQWIIETTGSYVKIKNRATGLYLDGNGSTNNRASIVQKIASDSPNQQWSQETAGSYVKFKNRTTGLYIDGLGLRADPSLLGQWQTSSHSNQQWSITTLGSSSGRESSSELSTSELGIKVYPNPFAKTFTLEVPDSGEPLQITILDAAGKAVETVVHSGSSNKLSLGSALKPGLYLVRVNSINGSQSFKVLKE
ncbi:glycoside hydrolase family 44 protein [Ohtaekwangia koreensis]|uniref:Por secretion system C-terminal sorting domain-containing protein n=1 Tax=Ohtaekwangia koreensis TaxID=688867 RepID=A0A1T5KII6_9BACT|nr:glycoside hydrolase family 44 protein [Ohtaekwangia koreensis]SKC63566.1 Por secretion system C-terminal sorting domain-containing protein [Ohtaekwangia koreensis]